MGSKGSNTTTTQQNQTYAPAGAGYLTTALNQAGNAAQLPFNIPQAPVAGFSQDQLNAFQTVAQSQGMAQPYIQQAQQYFSPQGAQQFYNPMASQVSAQLQNLFGQQQQQNNASLTQSAGGVGADRIAVGQGNLANSQTLAAGQIYANLYGQAQQAAQGAGYGEAALGSQAQNAALTGAQAQLGTGGLQQQLAQAQLNAPYQQQLAQAAFPYQQAQFLAGITGSLAPGLGGTTSGYGQTTAPAPSLLSQILGLGTAGIGAAGSLGAFGGSPSFGGGSPFSGDAYGGSGSSPLPGLTSADYGAGFGRGGRADPYCFDEGGTVSDDPIDISKNSIIPKVQLAPAHTEMPHLNLNPPAAQQQSGGGAQAIGDIAKMAMMFMKDGGEVPLDKRKTFDGHNPYSFFEHRFPQGYADGGAPDDDERQSGLDMLRDAMVGHGYKPSAPTSRAVDDVVNPGDPIRMPDEAAVNDWRKAVDLDRAQGQTATGSPSSDAPETTPVAFAPSNVYAPQAMGARSQPAAAPTQAAPEAAAPTRDTGFAGSPWAALMAAGLGMAAGTSPFAAVNIGQGGLQGLKMLEEQRAASQKDETLDQATRRLEQEAKHHEDQYTRMTPYQEAAVGMAQRKEALEELKPVQVGTDFAGHPIMARRDPKSGDYINVLTGKKVEDARSQFPNSSFKAPGTDEAALPENARYTVGVNVPEGVSPEVLQQFPQGYANKIRAVDEGRMSITQIPLKERAEFQNNLLAYDANWDQALWTLRNKQNADLSTNGNAGKMILATNQLIPHLKTASDKAAELANTNFPDLNSLKGMYLNATGDPRVKEFNAVREVASMDAARLLRGSGQMAEKDIEFWRETLASANSPAQLQGVIKMLADDLISARIKSIEYSYSQNMRMKAPEFVSPEAKAALQAINSRSQPAAAAPAAGAAPAAQAAPPAAAGPAPAGDPLAQARAAIAGGAPRDAVIKRLQDHGINPAGL